MKKEKNIRLKKGYHFFVLLLLKRAGRVHSDSAKTKTKKLQHFALITGERES